MSLQPLWSAANKTPYSGVFNVPPGQVCVLYASKFEAWKYRMEANEVLTPQAACVRRLLHGFTQPDNSSSLQCGWIFDMNNSAERIVDQVVQTHGCPWQLTACHNMGIIGVPGTYRLELNDTTAIGVAQVYAELYNAETFPVQVKDLFFL